MARKYNDIPIADPSENNDDVWNGRNYEEKLKDDDLPKLTDGDQEIENNNEQTYPSSKGFAIDEKVTIPITQKKNLELKKHQYEVEEERKADDDTFYEGSPLTMEEARDFVKENHYRTIINTSNPWTDPDTGRVHLFEKPRDPSRLA